MKDRFCDTAKLIFEDREFVDVENAIAQLNLDIHSKRATRRATTALHGSGIESVDKRDHYAKDKPSPPSLPWPGVAQSRSRKVGDDGASKSSQKKGTVSIETTRSESKTPEITITPGSEVTAVEVGTEIEARILSSSASELPDSGCGGLLDEEEEEDSILPENHSSSTGHRIIRSDDGTKTGGSSVRNTGSQVDARSLIKKRLLHVDGPLDGSPYAIINPLVKQRTFGTDSGFSVGVDQMKDLDSLINALREEAESIDAPNRQNHPISSNIPYHAREDSLPFSYTSPQSITSQSEKLHHHTHQSQQQQQQRASSSSYSTTTAVDSSGRVNHYPVSSPSPLYATPTPYANERYSSSSGRGGSRHDHHHHSGNAADDYSTLQQQILNPQTQPTSGLSRSTSHQPSYSNYERSQPVTSSGNQMVGSLSSSSSFNYGGALGNGNGSSSGVRRNRSQSADGRREYERGGDENADEWLARQQQKLREKKASKHVIRNDWLYELKRALPQTQQIERSQTDYSQRQTSTPIIQESFRPSQIISRLESIPQNQTPVSTFSSPRGGNVAYSSDDDDDVEIDIFQRGKKIQRHYSESTYDRTGGYNTSSSSRAPSQQSYTETPFPICPPTPYTNRPISPPGKPPRSPKAIRRYQGATSEPLGPIPMEVINSSRMERAQTPVNPRPIFMVDSEVKFAQDLSEFWYKPFAAREETVAALIQSPIGSFVVRNSNSFPGAYGLAVKADNSGEKGIRHFLIEPTRFGCRLRGCGTLEPVFGSLSALVYAHSIECLALPKTLTLPTYDILPSSQSQSTTAHLLRQGAACQLLFLGMAGVECLSGEEAITKGVNEISATSPVPISLRLSRSGLTLTDVFRKQFFRMHFALNEILYASVITGRSVAYGREIKQVFGIVARAPRASENSVILLAEFEVGQPASAIVSFITRVLAWQQH